jgi:hypothetical protein
MDEIERKRQQCRNKFLRNFPKGFYGEKYLAWERDYKLNAHKKWMEELNQEEFKKLLKNKDWHAIAQKAVNIETKTNLLFSFEKMALRDAVKSDEGAKMFSLALYDYVYGDEDMQARFEKFSDTLSKLPRKQTRVRTWPMQTVFGFIADPKHFIFLKPRVTMEAARKYGYPFEYSSRPGWSTWKSLMGFVRQIKKDIADLKPRDMIDIQSFIWVQGSEEYA